MDELKLAMNNHVDQFQGILEKVSAELRVGMQPAVDNFIGFFHAIDWKEDLKRQLFDYANVLFVVQSTIVSTSTDTVDEKNSILSTGGKRYHTFNFSLFGDKTKVGAWVKMVVGVGAFVFANSFVPGPAGALSIIQNLEFSSGHDTTTKHIIGAIMQFNGDGVCSYFKAEQSEDKDMSAIISFKENLIALQELDQSVEIIIRLLCTVPGLAGIDGTSYVLDVTIEVRFSVLSIDFVDVQDNERTQESKNTGLQSSVVSTRNATIKLIRALHKFIGPNIKAFLSNVFHNLLPTDIYSLVVDVLEPSVKDELLKNFCDKELMKDCFWDPIRASRAGKNRDKICLGQMPIKYK
ncbi:hypothetical protein Tco_1465610 [Tanacetum coccineum]